MPRSPCTTDASSTAPAAAQGPLGMRAAGALDGEVAFLAGSITKEMLFQGGVESIAGRSDVSLESLQMAPLAMRASRGSRSLRAR